MAYVPGCNYDLFISYASENNRDGWVAQFQEALGVELVELLGRQFLCNSIFFDKRDLEVAQSFPNKLVTVARTSAILIPILSPGYLTSAWCNRERAEFFSKLPYGAQPASCLAPIVIRPIDNANLDGLYRDAQRMSFLSDDRQTPLAPGSPQWIARLRQFAGQIRNALQSLRRNCRPVFLGKVPETHSSQSLRDWCRTELEHRHFRIVPEYLQALDDSDVTRNHLQQACLAIHFLGGADPAALEAIYSSINVCPGQTVLYQPFGVVLEPDEELWLGEFENGVPGKPGRYQRLAGKNDQELLALLEQMTQTLTDAGVDTTPKFDLALVCERVDLEDVRRLKEMIETGRNVEVDFPDFLFGRPTPTESLRKWQDYLKRGEALLFYYGASDRNRLEAKWRQAERDSPKIRRDWYLAPPDLDIKRQQHPKALWELEQIVCFIEENGSAEA